MIRVSLVMRDIRNPDRILLKKSIEWRTILLNSWTRISETTLLLTHCMFILPTIYDPFSNACLEALTSGLPVITTRSNGFSEIFEDGAHGSIVDNPANLAGLRDAIRFWSDRSRREAARSANIERASQFDISKNVAQTLEILKRVAL